MAKEAATTTTTTNDAPTGGNDAPASTSTPSPSGEPPKPDSLISGGNPSGDATKQPAADPTPKAAPKADNQQQDGGTLIPGTEKSADPWYAKLDVDARYLTDAVKGMKGPGDAVKSFVETQKLLGKRTLKRPSEDATPEQWAEYREAVGVPKDADGYQWDIPEGMEDVFTADGLGSFKEAALQNDLTPSQFEGVMKHYAQMHGQSMQHLADAQVAERVATEQALRSEWGGDYDMRLERVADVARRTGLGEMLSDLGVGNSRQAVQVLDKLASMLPEQDNPAATGGNVEGELDALRRNPAYMDGGHPGHGEVMKRIEALMRRKYNR